jgi:hypothetical protein
METGQLRPDRRTVIVTISPATAGRSVPVRAERPAVSKQARRPAPQRAPELAPLTLEELRAYRQSLLTEEARVSYWRRLLQARIDVTSADETSLNRLRDVLSEHQVSSRRLALLPMGGPADALPLPDLAVLWETEGAAGDRGGLVDRLAAAEQQLSTYRRGLHARLDAATGELISRYRDDPALALRALPLPRTAECGVA